MDLEAIIKELRIARDRVEASIIAVERLAAGSARRGRPPKWLTAVKAIDAPKRRGRPPGSRKKGE